MARRKLRSVNLAEKRHQRAKFQATVTTKKAALLKTSDPVKAAKLRADIARAEYNRDSIRVRKANKKS